MAKNVFIQSADTEMSLDLLREAITVHQALVSKKYLPLKMMYEGDHDILHNEKKEGYKPDNRLVVNFAKYIVDTFNGYFIGNPIQTTHDNDTVADYLDYLDGYNDQDDNNAELSKLCSIYGHAYEVVFADESAQIGLDYLSPLEAFLIYDDSIRRKPLFGIYYYLNAEDRIEGSWCDSDRIVYFKQGTKGYEITDEQEHYFGSVPIIEYVENEEKQSIFENVRTLINAFNKALSEKANDVEYYADAYLKILGGELDEETLEKLRDKRIINIASNGGEAVAVEFLSKPDADGTQENLLERLQSLIFEMAMVANISDENFGASSGIALRYKLQSMDNLARVKERKFTSGMNRRYRLISHFPTSKINDDDWASIRYKFTRNIPANLLEETQIAQNLAGIVSNETQLSTLSIVPNPIAELEKKEGEIVGQEQPIQRGLLEEPSESNVE